MADYEASTACAWSTRRSCRTSAGKHQPTTILIGERVAEWMRGEAQTR